MNPIQFFTGRVAPFRLTKKKVQPKLMQAQDQSKEKSDFEERRRMAAYWMDQEAKRFFNGHL
jgi:hypothetical protein